MSHLSMDTCTSHLAIALPVGIMRESPEAEALLITCLVLCLMAGDDGGTFTLGMDSRSEAPGRSSTGDSSRRLPLSMLERNKLDLQLNAELISNCLTLK